MFCYNCGIQIAGGADFCHKCGAKLSVDIPAEQPADSPKINPVQQPMTDPHTNPVQQPSPVPMNASRKKRSKLPIIAGAAALTIFFGILAVIGIIAGLSAFYSFLLDDNDDYSNAIDRSLVGRWRSSDGGYVEFSEYGKADVSFKPHGSLINPDYFTWGASNGQIVLTSYLSSTNTWEITDWGSEQTLILNKSFLSSTYYRQGSGSSLVGTWDRFNSGYRSPGALVLLSDGTGTMDRLISSSSTGTVPITWWADETKLYLEWTLQTAYDYTVSGDKLTLYFSNGSKTYQKIGS